MTQTERFEPRLSPLSLATKDMTSPQTVFYDKATKVRAERIEGVVHLYRHEDIIRLNRHSGTLGVGGRGGTFGVDSPLIPLEVDGPDHSKWRRLLDPMFSPKQMAFLDASVRNRAQDLVQRFLPHGSAELYEDLCVPLPCLTFLNLVGAPTDDLDFFLQFKEGVIHPQGETVDEMNANMAAAGAKMFAYLAEFIAKRRAEPEEKEDITSALIRSTIDGEALSDMDLYNILFLFMFAGLDTVTGAMSCMVARLGQHPQERRRLVEDPTLIPGAVEELLRYESPVPTGVRYAAADIDLGDGLVVHDGEAIAAVWAAANLDPASHADPLNVDFERPRQHHIAFASGTHRCLGSHLARMELRIALEVLLQHIPDYTIEPGQEISYDNEPVRVATHIPVVFPTANR